MNNASPESVIARGLALHGQKRWDEACGYWQDALARLPGHPAILLHLGMARVRCNQFGEAAALFDALRARFPQDPVGDLGSGFLMEARQDWGAAAQLYRALLARFPDHPAALAGLARTLVKIGRQAEARRLLDEACARHPASALHCSVRDAFSKVSKTDIANALARTFGLRRFLEYNKPLGGLVIEGIDCPEKTLAYIPEHEFCDAQDARITDRAKLAAEANGAAECLGHEELAARYRDRRFDLIFYDPMHVRPGVDRALQVLCALLAPDGFLMVHDCNPEDAALTTRHRYEEAWLGETYQAFANFHRHNPGRSLTVAEDFGVGIILNRGLELDYPLDFDIDYASFASNREKYIGLISHETFCARLASGDRARLMLG